MGHEWQRLNLRAADVALLDCDSLHRDDVQSAIRAAVKRVLHKRGLTTDEIDAMVPPVMDQGRAVTPNGRAPRGDAWLEPASFVVPPRIE